jgi:tetratricopeptide (TPR) repeat protein
MVMSTNGSQKEFLEYLDRQIENLNSKDEAVWRQAFEPLILALPWAVPRLVEAVKTGKVRLDGAASFADTLSLVGAIDESERIFRAIKEKNPENVAYLNNLAVVLLKTGDKAKIEEAIDLLDKAVKLDADHYGYAAREQPAFRNREIAVSLLRVATKAAPEKPTKEASPGTLEAVEKQVLREYQWQAGAETVLEICAIALKYAIPVFLGIIFPLALFIGPPIGFSLNTSGAVVYILVVLVAFGLARYGASYLQKKATMRVGGYLSHYRELTQFALKKVQEKS